LEMAEGGGVRTMPVFVIRILSFLRISSLVIRIGEEWFMESLLGRAAVHRDQEPAGQTLGAPASRRRGRRRSQARFMESRHSLLRVHWTMDPPLTPPRRGTDGTPTDACSPPGRGRGWVGLW